MKNLTKKLISPIIALSLSVMPFNSFPQSNETVNIGPLSVNLQWCQKYQNLAAIMSSITNVRLPVNGGLGMTMGFIQTDNPIVAFCDYMIGLQRLSGIDAIFFTADTANRVFELKKDQELGLMRDFYDLSSTAYSFESGEFNKEKVFTPQYARRMDQFYRNVGDYYDENIAENSSEAMNVQTRRERERDMQRLARLAQRRQTLEENISCSDPEKRSGPNYAKIAGEINKLNEEVRDNDLMAMEYERVLSNMLVKLSNNVEEHTKYRRLISDITQLGLAFTSRTANFTENSFVREEVSNRGSDPLADRTKEVKKKVEQKYQIVSVRVDQSYLERANQEVGERWNSYVKSAALSSLSKSKEDIEEEFKSMSAECGNAVLVKNNNLDYEDPDFNYKLKRFKEECEKNSRVRTSNAGGLFNENLQRLFEFRKNEREAKAKIYTLESQHLGVFRDFSVAERQDKAWEDSYSRTEVTCSDTPSMAMMQRQQVELEKTNLSANMIIAEQLTKQNALKEAQLERDKKSAEEERVRREIHRSNVENRTKIELKPETIDI